MAVMTAVGRVAFVSLVVTRGGVRRSGGVAGSGLRPVLGVVQGGAPYILPPSIRAMSIRPRPASASARTTDERCIRGEVAKATAEQDHLPFEQGDEPLQALDGGVRLEQGLPSRQFRLDDPG